MGPYSTARLRTLTGVNKDPFQDGWIPTAGVFFGDSRCGRFSVQADSHADLLAFQIYICLLTKHSYLV